MPNNDLISKADAIQAARHAWAKGLEPSQYIEIIPAIDAAPVVHGRWVKMTGMLPTQYHGHYECSECQWHMKGLRNSWTQEEELTYCPNCGAKMDGGESDAEQ